MWMSFLDFFGGFGYVKQVKLHTFSYLKGGSAYLYREKHGKTMNSLGDISIFPHQMGTY